MRNKIIAAAVLCIAAFAACGNENENSETTAVYTEISTSSITEEATEAAATETEETEPSAPESESSVSVSCSEITSKILDTVEMSSMAEVGADRIVMYLDCTIPSTSDFSMYICGSGGFADEIFVMRTEDVDISLIEGAVQKRIDTRKTDFEGYNPDEYDKLENFYSASKNGYYIYAVTSDNAACEQIFEEYVK
ncbi:MAG: DUF4358 domain-containing protein [Oscillospiraceae bacterium]|nr:DUF4358 domain-containing protein [Oscillospiraceae bacterium]